MFSKTYNNINYFIEGVNYILFINACISKQVFGNHKSFYDLKFFFNT